TGGGVGGPGGLSWTAAKADSSNDSRMGIEYLLSLFRSGPKNDGGGTSAREHQGPAANVGPASRGSASNSRMRIEYLLSLFQSGPKATAAGLSSRTSRLSFQRRDGGDRLLVGLLRRRRGAVVLALEEADHR